MRNRLASLIVVKQEPPSSNTLVTLENSLNTHLPYGTNEINNNINNNNNFNPNNASEELNAAATISIKSETNLYEINNNHLHHSDNYNFPLSANSNHKQSQSPITSAASNPPNLIYPCRNLFPDGCDISHHGHHNNCSNYYYNLNDTPSPVTPPYATSQGEKFVLKSEPLSYDHSVLDVVAAAAAASATSPDNLWCLSNFTYRKQLGNFNVTSSLPDHSFPNTNFACIFKKKKKHRTTKLQHIENFSYLKKIEQHPYLPSPHKPKTY
ncbi:uncharacterized protein LOC142225123 [Haematobia irritans]|uniref:uncharacterized protein LOC142225123 n=1 Tax=Haematobia irritans TaxID=7368 RepID=UPI003F4FE88D